MSLHWQRNALPTGASIVFTFLQRNLASSPSSRLSKVRSTLAQIRGASHFRSPLHGAPAVFCCNTGLADQGLVRALERILKEHTSSQIPTEEPLDTEIDN